MKLIIIEGPDNTGKSTVIQGLCNKISKSLVIHSSAPLPADHITQAVCQNESFCKLAEVICGYADLDRDMRPDAVILDRAWPGEGVYGVLYRNNSIEYVKKMFDNIHSIFNRHDENIAKKRRIVEDFKDTCYEQDKYIAGCDTLEIFYYFLMPEEDAVEFLVKNDDGMSIKSGLEEKEKEVAQFNEVYNILKQQLHRITSVIDGSYSYGNVIAINKVIVTKDGKFRSREDILKEIRI